MVFNVGNSDQPFIYLFFQLFALKACGILVPQPGFNLLLPLLTARSPNRWTTMEVSGDIDFFNQRKVEK